MEQLIDVEKLNALKRYLLKQDLTKRQGSEEEDHVEEDDYRTSSLEEFNLNNYQDYEGMSDYPVADLESFDLSAICFKFTYLEAKRKFKGEISYLDNFTRDSSDNSRSSLTLPKPFVSFSNTSVRKPSNVTEVITLSDEEVGKEQESSLPSSLVNTYFGRIEEAEILESNSVSSDIRDTDSMSSYSMDDILIEEDILLDEIVDVKTDFDYYSEKNRCLVILGLGDHNYCSWFGREQVLAQRVENIEKGFHEIGIPVVSQDNLDSDWKKRKRIPKKQWQEYYDSNSKLRKINLRKKRNCLEKEEKPKMKLSGKRRKRRRTRDIGCVRQNHNSLEKLRRVELRSLFMNLGANVYLETFTPRIAKTAILTDAAKLIVTLQDESRRLDASLQKQRQIRREIQERVKSLGLQKEKNPVRMKSK